MTRKRRTIETLMGVVTAMSVAGCWVVPGGQAPETVEQEPPTNQADFIERAHQADAGAGGDSAVENALIWSEKYARAMEQVLRFQNDNRDLDAKNRGLVQQLATSQTELKQTQKELADANELLLEMRRELDRWKTNVLGFRKEMRDAQQAELEALTKVIRLLGGEVVEATTQPAPKEAAKSDAKSGEPGA